MATPQRTWALLKTGSEYTQIGYTLYFAFDVEIRSVGSSSGILAEPTGLDADVLAHAGWLPPGIDGG